MIKRITQAVSLAINSYSIKDVLMELFLGKFQKVGWIKQKSRYKKCQKCSERRWKFCGICFCFIPAKILAKKSKCPINKW
jgi:hypothetical protein